LRLDVDRARGIPDVSKLPNECANCSAVSRRLHRGRSTRQLEKDPFSVLVLQSKVKSDDAFVLGVESQSHRITYGGSSCKES